MERPEPISVSALTRQIRETLETEVGEVAVTGEISNFRAPGSGHWYFTLKDEGAVLNAVMFRGEAMRAGFRAADGQAVVAQGRVTVYEARGQYQLIVSHLQPRGAGTLQQQFEALKLKLAAEGLFAEERKRPRPRFPETVGIVTALQGAVLQDFTRILKRRAPGLRIQVRGVRVQGIGAGMEIAQAVEQFNRDGEVAVIVVARGGGSLEDLWAFNEEGVARALAASTIPTISAVGHETDFTMADFVADLRAPTPSAAAELLSQDWVEAPHFLQQRLIRLQRAARHELTRRQENVARLRQSYVFREPIRVVQQFQQKVDDLTMELRLVLQRGFQERRHAWEKVFLRWAAVHPNQTLARRRDQWKHAEERLRLLGPQATLARGYALVLNEQGAVVRQADPGLVNRTVEVRLAQGVLSAKVTTASP
jgi:exodeoxyribonuclease VII large subunit